MKRFETTVRSGRRSAEGAKEQRMAAAAVVSELAGMPVAVEVVESSVVEVVEVDSQ